MNPRVAVLLFAFVACAPGPEGPVAALEEPGDAGCGGGVVPFVDTGPMTFCDANDAAVQRVGATGCGSGSGTVVDASRLEFCDAGKP